MRINNYNRQTFQGARLKGQSFECFREYALKNNFLETFPRIIHPDNYINEGLCNKVYRIPDNSDFLLRVRKAPAQGQNLGLEPVVDDFPELNVGQEIARLNENVTVIITQKGEPCGIRHFSGKKMTLLQPEDKTQFIKYISTIAGFPLKAYENLIKEVQLVNKHKLYDVHNPQNVLYDTENKCFNIVDVSPRDRLRQMFSPLALASQLCDFRNLFSVLKISDSKDRELICKSVNSIMKQVRQAAKNTGLKPSIKPYLHKIYNLMKGKKKDEAVNFAKFSWLYRSEKGCALNG